MEGSDDVRKRLLSIVDLGYEDEDDDNQTAALHGKDESGFWQRKKAMWAKRKKRLANPCCLGFICLVLFWSVLALATTLLCYFHLSHSLLNKYSFVKSIELALNGSLTNR